MFAVRTISVHKPAASGPVGSAEYTTPGTYTWTCPAGVTSVCVVAVGGGGKAGGGLGWRNNIPVTPGVGYTVQVGAGGGSVEGASKGGDSWFFNSSTVRGHGGDAPDFSTAESTGLSWGGQFTAPGGGGGWGGNSNFLDGGGGAAGYTDGGGDGGEGGSGGFVQSTVGANGRGGGGAGGQATYWTSEGEPIEGETVYWGAGGGGVGLLGQGANGIAATPAGPPNPTLGGGGGSGGTAGGNGNTSIAPNGPSAPYLANGGLYGGGAGVGGTGGNGAVRIIWGAGRSFPNNAA